MKISLLIFLSFILSLTLFGQSSSQMAANQQNRQADTDKAIVYIYAPKAPPTLGRIRKPVFLNGRKIADIQPATENI